MIKGKRERQGW